MSHAGAGNWRWVRAALLLATGTVVGGCANSVVETTWSPEGNDIAYVAEGGLYTYDLATKETRALRVGENEILAPAWSPDGKMIAFYEVTFGESGSVALRTLRTDTGEIRTLAADVWPLPLEVDAAKLEGEETAEEARHKVQEEAMMSVAFVAAISWSPDSSWLACTSGSAAGGGLVTSTGPGEQYFLTDATRLAFVPAWSPDGTRIAYLRAEGPASKLSTFGDADGETDENELVSLWTYDAAARTSAKVCDLSKDGYTPGTRLEWSADSREIGLMMDDPHDEDRAIGYRVVATPGSAFRKDTVQGLTRRATWAPGLKGVAFVEDRKGAQVLMYRGLQPRTHRALAELPDAVPEEGEMVTETGGDEQGCSLPTFSRDGRRIALLVGPSKARRPVVFDAP